LKGRRHVGCLALGALLLAVTPAPAQERALNERHPVRLGDAFPVGRDDISLLAAGTVIVPRDGSPRGTLPLDLQYGVLTNAQLSLSTQASTTRVDDPGSGDLTLAGRIGFTTESVMLLFVATQLAVTAPTGAGARAVDLELKGYASRELRLGVLQVFLHLNAAAESERAISARASDVSSITSRPVRASPCLTTRRRPSSPTCSWIRRGSAATPRPSASSSVAGSGSRRGWRWTSAWGPK
jgi:hypothetical protein